MWTRVRVRKRFDGNPSVRFSNDDAKALWKEVHAYVRTAANESPEAHFTFRIHNDGDSPIKKYKRAVYQKDLGWYFI